MSSITVRNLDEHVKSGLRLRAARSGHSMEQEVREILQHAVNLEPAGELNLAERINRRFKSLDASNIPVPERQTTRTPPEFDAA